MSRRPYGRTPLGIAPRRRTRSVIQPGSESGPRQFTPIELLALVDALRDGRARERKLAEEMIASRLRAAINAWYNRKLRLRTARPVPTSAHSDPERDQRSV